MTGKRLTPDQRQTLAAMLLDGRRYDEIAATFNITPSAVTYHAIRLRLARKGAAQTQQPATRQSPTQTTQRRAAKATVVPTGLTPPGPWTRHALCAQTDPEEFFPNAGESPNRAKAICNQCPVRRACLAYALTHNEMGVWGGTTEAERKRIRKDAA